MDKTCVVCEKAITTGRKSRKYCSKYCGNKLRNERFKQSAKEKYLAGKRRINEKVRLTPWGKYQQHKGVAKQRGIDFLLTFEEWWSLWEPYWEQRGRGGMVMCRSRDKGPYAIGNVRIDTQANNNREAHAKNFHL